MGTKVIPAALALLATAVGLAGCEHDGPEKRPRLIRSLLR